MNLLTSSQRTRNRLQLSQHVANYRPISNLNNISKIREKLFMARLQPHIVSSLNFNQLQSAYRPLHSTETALLHTLNAIYRSNLRPVSSAKVYKIISTLPPKSSPLDFIPTSLIIRCSSVFMDIVVNLANLSFERGKFPTSYKAAVITPLLKNQVSMHP